MNFLPRRLGTDDRVKLNELCDIPKQLRGNAVHLLNSYYKIRICVPDTTDNSLLGYREPLHGYERQCAQNLLIGLKEDP